MDKGRKRSGVQVQNRQHMEERLKTMEEINNKNIIKMQQSHRIQAKVYEKMLSEQEQFWKEQLAEKEEQMNQMEVEIDESRNRELVLLSEMEALEQRSMEGTSTLTQNFMEAYNQLADAMFSLEHMKLCMEDNNKKKKKDGRRRKDRDDRMKSKASEDESEDGAQDSVNFKSNAYNRMPSSMDHNWKQQIEQLDGKWVQIKDIMELMREDMEQKSTMGSTALKQNFTEAYGHLTDCMGLMDSVKRELEEQVKKRRKEKQGIKEGFWRRWCRRIQEALGIGMQVGGQIGGQVGGQVYQWTGLDLSWNRRSSSRPSPGLRRDARRSPRRSPFVHGRSQTRERSRQPQRDDP